MAYPALALPRASDYNMRAIIGISHIAHRFYGAHINSVFESTSRQLCFMGQGDGVIQLH